ncbi:MAG: GDP-mannose 4,6-dehydratase [Firmicutes bacterium]|nr:NAD-dependent epimerase/dehydratase family protein [Alicyclobacillaceae bacterium]MCL6497132.1 GDP-mannose 4,6-dehydratase [Bacillota bacterium]
MIQYGIGVGTSGTEGTRLRTAIVTGGAGFIGSHLVDRLVAEGWDQVVVLDNLVTGSWENLAGHHPDRVRRIFHDVCEPWDETAWNLEGVDLVVHLASPASPVHYRRLALETMWANSRGTGHALEVARRFNARFILGSTSETYGDPLVSPQDEGYWGNVNPIGPRACYDESKRFGEALTMEYHRRYGLDVRILRFFNCYGPRMQQEDGRVVPNFIRQALTGEPLTVYGDGSQTRSFCYVSDEVEAIFQAAVRPGLAGEVFNVGNPEERTILSFAELVADLVGVPLRTVKAPLPADDPKSRCPNIQKARQLLGWEPKVPLREGLRRTIEYFRARLEASR